MPRKESQSAQKAAQEAQCAYTEAPAIAGLGLGFGAYRVLGFTVVGLGGLGFLGLRSMKLQALKVPGLIQEVRVVSFGGLEVLGAGYGFPKGFSGCKG